MAPQVNTVNEANAAPATNVQPDASANASAPVPPPRPHTIEQAFYQGELVTVRCPILFLRLLPDLSSTIMWSTCLRFRSQNRGCQGSQVLHLHQDHSMSMASLHTTLSLIEPRTHIPSQEYHQIGSGAISNAAITHALYTTKGAYFLICVWIPKLLLAYHA